MTSSPKFHVDVIFNSLRELEQEKERLLGNLNEQRKKRKALEEIVMTAHSKCKQSSDRNTQLKEAVNVAHERVLQAEEQAERLKSLNEEKRQSISEVNKMLENEDQREKEEVTAFESELSELTEKLRGARRYYENQNLRNELKKWEESQDEYQKKADAELSALNELTEALNNIELDIDELKEKEIKKLEYDLTAQDLQSALVVFNGIKQEADQYLVDMQAKLDEEQSRAKKEINKDEVNSKLIKGKNGKRRKRSITK